MVRPWEEAWISDASGSVRLSSGSLRLIPSEDEDGRPMLAQARFIAAAPDLYRALAMIEWVWVGPDEGGDYECPSCGASRLRGHRSDARGQDPCRLNAALHKARGEQ